MVKKILNRFFIDGLTGMSYGLFATLIIGTILQQIGTLISGEIGTYLYQFGKIAAGMTKRRYRHRCCLQIWRKSSGCTLFCNCRYGWRLFKQNPCRNDFHGGCALLLSGPGEPLGAFLAAILQLKLLMLSPAKPNLTYYYPFNRNFNRFGYRSFLWSSNQQVND